MRLRYLIKNKNIPICKIEEYGIMNKVVEIIQTFTAKFLIEDELNSYLAQYKYRCYFDNNVLQLEVK